MKIHFYLSNRALISSFLSTFELDSLLLTLSLSGPDGKYWLFKKDLLLFPSVSLTGGGSLVILFNEWGLSTLVATLSRCLLDLTVRSLYSLLLMLFYLFFVSSSAFVTFLLMPYPSNRSSFCMFCYYSISANFNLCRLFVFMFSVSFLDGLKPSGVGSLLSLSDLSLPVEWLWSVCTTWPKIPLRAPASSYLILRVWSPPSKVTVLPTNLASNT